MLQRANAVFLVLTKFLVLCSEILIPVILFNCHVMCVFGLFTGVKKRLKPSALLSAWLTSMPNAAHAQKRFCISLILLAQHLYRSGASAWFFDSFI